MTWTKDPDATLDYKRDWSAWLAEVSDTIQTSTWTVPPGITKTDDTHDATTATVWLSGGTVGDTYEIANRITTVGGRTDERTFSIFVHNR